MKKGGRGSGQLQSLVAFEQHQRKYYYLIFLKTFMNIASSIENDNLMPHQNLTPSILIEKIKTP